MLLIDPPRIGSANLASGTHSALIAPRLSLASCVRAHVTRSTRGADLRPDQRYNHFPASPLCAITWLLHGESLVVRRGGACVAEPVPAIAVVGPQTEHSVSFNPGPIHGITVMLTPEALVALAGLDVATLVNRVVPLETVLDHPWQAMAQAVWQAPSDVARFQIIEEFLEPHWNTVRRDAMPKADRYRYWAEGLVLRAATSGVGTSLRQMERRIKQWAGLPMRELRRMARAEESFIHNRDAYMAGSLDWASAAVEGGYSDQAHLCRDARRMTGLSTNELRKAILTEEGFWLYRLWG